MIRRLRGAFGGGISRQAADAAVGRGMAEVLAALDTVIDDDAALGRLHAGFGTSVPGAAQGPGTTADEACTRTRMSGSDIITLRAGRPAASRRLALRAVAGVAAALTAGAVALVAVGVPGARHDGTDLTSYVVKRVDSALRAADPGMIAQMRVTTSLAPVAGGKTTTTTAEEWSYGDRWRSVTNSAAGHLVYGEGFGPSTGYTLVSYPRRTWARLVEAGRPAAEPLSGTRACGQVSAVGPVLFQPSLPGTGLPPTSLRTVARTLRAAVSCGTLDVAGRQRLDRVEAIKLTAGRNSPISETIWVSPGTYLPVRVVIRSFLHHSLVLNNQVVLRQTADFTWLPPAPQNLAKLTVPIPAGFRHVSYGQAVQPITQRMPQGLLPRAASARGLGYPGQRHSRGLLPYPRPQKPS